LKTQERGTATGGCVRPPAGLVKIDNLLIVLDRSPGRERRRTLGPVPQLKVLQDLLNNRAVADQADDCKWSAAAGTDQGVGFSYTFLINQAHERLRPRANSSPLSESSWCIPCAPAAGADADAGVLAQTRCA
jgi:hypothetical protein